jgi:hypothetical protein
MIMVCFINYLLTNLEWQFHYITDINHGFLVVLPRSQFD